MLNRTKWKGPVLIVCFMISENCPLSLLRIIMKCSFQKLHLPFYYHLEETSSSFLCFTYLDLLCSLP